MDDYYTRFWKSETIDKPPLYLSQKEILSFSKDIVKFKKYLKGKCLDAGCGNGFTTSELNKITPSVGLDISDIAIRKSKEKYPNIKFVKGSVTDLPFKKNQFGCIFATEVIEHIEDTEAMFHEFNRVLKKNGHLIIIAPELTRLKNIFIALFYWDKYYYPTKTHIRFYSKKTLTEILKKFKFKIIHYEPEGRFFWKIPKGMLVVSKKIR